MITRDFIRSKIERAEERLAEYERDGHPALVEVMERQLAAWRRLLWELPTQRSSEE